MCVVRNRINLLKKVYVGPIRHLLKRMKNKLCLANDSFNTLKQSFYIKLINYFSFLICNKRLKAFVSNTLY